MAVGYGSQVVYLTQCVVWIPFAPCFVVGLLQYQVFFEQCLMVLSTVKISFRGASMHTISYLPRSDCRRFQKIQGVEISDSEACVHQQERVNMSKDLLTFICTRSIASFRKAAIG